jgi:nitroreductase
VTEYPLTPGLDELMRSRRTVGAFLPEPPPMALVRRAMELACWAPNHRKTEPWRFHLIGPQTRQSIIELNTRLVAETKGTAEAEKKRQQWSSVPGWLAVTCVISGDDLQQQEDYAACCCAVQNLMLSLWNQGIGTKWSTGGVTRHPEFARLLGHSVTAPEQMVAMLWYGYPRAIPTQTRRPIDEVLRALP